MTPEEKETFIRKVSSLKKANVEPFKREWEKLCTEEIKEILKFKRSGIPFSHSLADVGWLEEVPRWEDALDKSLVENLDSSYFSLIDYLVLRGKIRPLKTFLTIDNITGFHKGLEKAWRETPISNFLKRRNSGSKEDNWEIIKEILQKGIKERNIGLIKTAIANQEDDKYILFLRNIIYEAKKKTRLKKEKGISLEIK